MIKPTVGRVVWYWPRGKEQIAAGEQPCAAQISYVHGDTCVNVGYLGPNGDARNATSVTLYQGEGEGPRPDYAHAEWMPYQRGEAARAPVGSGG